MESFLKKFKSERKTENKNYDKIKQLEITLFKIKYENDPNKLQTELRELNKIHVIDRK